MAMKSTDNDRVLADIRAKSEEYSAQVYDAMLDLELINATEEDFKAACRRLAKNSFAVAYLSRIETVAEEGSIRATENIIRYHSFMQDTKGGYKNLKEPIDFAQAEVTGFLNELINRYFNE